MNEYELKTTLLKLIRLKHDAMPSHQIRLEFQNDSEDVKGVENFIAYLQQKLHELQAGFIDFYGLDEDHIHGELFIQCNTGKTPLEVYKFIETYLTTFHFIINGYAHVIEEKQINKFITLSFRFNTQEDKIINEAEPELPTPEEIKAATKPKKRYWSWFKS